MARSTHHGAANPPTKSQAPSQAPAPSAKPSGGKGGGPTAIRPDMVPPPTVPKNNLRIGQPMADKITNWTGQGQIIDRLRQLLAGATVVPRPGGMAQHPHGMPPPPMPNPIYGGPGTGGPHGNPLGNGPIGFTGPDGTQWPSAADYWKSIGSPRDANGNPIMTPPVAPPPVAPPVAPPQAPQVGGGDAGNGMWLNSFGNGGVGMGLGGHGNPNAPTAPPIAPGAMPGGGSASTVGAGGSGFGAWGNQYGVSGAQRSPVRQPFQPSDPNAAVPDRGAQGPRAGTLGVMR